MTALSLRDLSRRYSDGGNPSTKPPGGALYDLYDHYFRAMAEEPVTLLELGVHAGESLKVFASYFGAGTVVGVDLEDHRTDFSAWSNIAFAVADQTDADALAEICRAHAPQGLDIVIDDASHFGAASLAAYSILFPQLKPGGLYIIEDWTTGYWTDWPDGGLFEEPRITQTGAVLSHHSGMVGFIKSLVDEVASDRIRPTVRTRPTRARRLDVMHVHREMVVLQKAAVERVR